MKEYPKIETLLERDERTHLVIEGKWRTEEFAYLSTNSWLFTEKVDGTNIRIMWDGATVRFGGKTDAAQIYQGLLARLQDLFPASRFESLSLPPLCLYGEGYGARVQKGGGLYKSDGTDFVLFDVLIDGWWLERRNIEDVGTKLEIGVVPIVGGGSLQKAVDLVQAGVDSTWGAFRAEGFVVRPAVDLYTRKGDRIIGKIKTRDFAPEGRAH